MDSIYTLQSSENGPCTEEGSTRLTHVGSTTEPVGRLEMCYDGYWGSVCNDFAGANTAAVACRQLGYDVIGQHIFFLMIAWL